MPKLKHKITGHVSRVTDAQAKVIQRDKDWEKASDDAVVGPNPDYKPAKPKGGSS
jgi:hypothetical protein